MHRSLATPCLALAFLSAACASSVDGDDELIGLSTADGDTAAGATSNGTGDGSTIARGGGDRGAGGADAGGATYGPSSAGGMLAGGSLEQDSAGPSAPDSATYESVGTNPFVMTAFDPWSTFAADVDTASYDIFRRAARGGRLPSADSVRLEEYVNYFDYGYAAPNHDSSIPFSLHLAAAPNLTDRDTVLLRVGIQGKAAPPEQNKPANIVFLVDTSGSMQFGDKGPLVKVVLKEALDVLKPTDTVSLVTYAGSTRVALGPTAVSSKGAILDAIDGLASGGSTAGAAGIDLAYAQAEAGFVERGINHVVLMTDGDFNVGPSSDEALVSLIEQKRKTGVTLTALGFGHGNDSMMEKVSNAGDGVYGVITDSNQAKRYVNTHLVSSLNLIAKDLKLQVEMNPEKVLAYRLLGYENRAIADEDFRNDTVDAGEVGAGHRVTALYELVLTGGIVPVPADAPQPTRGEPNAAPLEVTADDLALVKVRFKEVGATEQDPAIEVNATLAADDVGTTYGDLDADAQWALAIATFAEIVKESPYADPDRLDLIAAIIGRPAYDDDPLKVEFRGYFDAVRDAL